VPAPFFYKKRKHPFVPRPITKKYFYKSSMDEKVFNFIDPKEMLFKSWKNKADMFLSISKKHGDFSSFFIANELTFGVFAPADVYDVLVGKQNQFIKGNAWNRIRKFAGDGLVTAEEPSHMKNRRYIQPHFNHKKIIEDYSRVMVNKVTERQQQYLNYNKKMDLHNEMVSLVFDIVIESLFGITEKVDSSKVKRNMEIAMDSVERTIAPGLDRYDFSNLPIFKKFRVASLDLHEFSLGLIAKRKTSTENHEDLLSLLINSEMTDEQICDEVITIILAGFETTANTLSWAFSYLNANPYVYKELINESKRISVSENFIDEINNSEILDGIVKETLRLKPSLWILPRMAANDVTVGEKLIPKGGNVILSPYVTHRDPLVYQDPEKFIPSRWKDNFEKTLPRGSYVPFSAGPRKCIGDQFALLEMKIILCLFSAKFKIKVHGKFPEAAARGTLRLANKVKMSIEDNNV
jgi:cytochrome P450